MKVLVLLTFVILFVVADYSTITLSNDEQRYYILYVPESLKTIEKELEVPLLVVQHGGGGNANSFFESSEMYKVAELEKFILVHTEGIPAIGQHSFCTWASGSISTRDVEEDVLYLNELIELVISNTLWTNQYLKIDQKKILLAGHSNGAMLTYTFASKTSIPLHGIIPVSGTVGGWNKDKLIWYYPPSKTNINTNIFHIHGRNDEQVKIAGGKTEGGFPSQDGRNDLSLDYGLSYWSRINGCSCYQNTTTLCPKTEQSEGKLTYYSLDGCQNKTIKYLLISDAGHPWSEMDIQVNNTVGPIFGINTNSLSQLIWNIIKPSLNATSNDDTNIPVSRGSLKIPSLFVYFCIFFVFVLY